MTAETFPYKRILILAAGLGGARIARACRALKIESVGLSKSADKVAPFDQVIVFDRNKPDYDKLRADLQALPMDAAHIGLAGSVAAPDLLRCLKDTSLPLIGRADIAEPAHWWRAAAKRENIKTLPTLIAAESPNLWDEANGRDMFPCAVYFDDTTHQIADEESLFALRDAHPDQQPRMIQQVPKRSRRIAVIAAKDHRDEIYPIADIDHSLHFQGRLVYAETPCPELTTRPDGEAIRQLMFDQTVRILRNAPGPELYAVVFSLDADGAIALEDLRTGLIRMHALAERVSGLDLGCLQIELAAKSLTRTRLESIQTDGCAVGAIIWDNPEAPAKVLQLPPVSDAQARIEASIDTEGNNPDAPLLFTIVSSALMRHRALLLMDRLIAQTQIDSEPPTRASLRQLLRSHVFRAARYDRETRLHVVAVPAQKAAS